MCLGPAPKPRRIKIQLYQSPHQRVVPLGLTGLCGVYALLDLGLAIQGAGAGAGTGTGKPDLGVLPEGYRIALSVSPAANDESVALGPAPAGGDYQITRPTLCSEIESEAWGQQ